MPFVVYLPICLLLICLFAHISHSKKENAALFAVKTVNSVDILILSL